MKHQLEHAPERLAERRRRGRRHVPTRPLDFLIVALITAVGIWTAWSGLQLLRADLASLQARYRIDNWQSGKVRWSYEEWQQARSDLQAALAITPGNATLHEYLGMLHVLAGLKAWAVAPARLQLYGEARQHQRRALELRPTHGLTWAHLARSEYAVEACSPAQWEAWRKALYFSPHEPVVQGMLSDLVMACARQAPEEAHAWLASHYQQGSASVRKEIEAAASRYGVAGFEAALKSLP